MHDSGCTTFLKYRDENSLTVLEINELNEACDAFNLAHPLENIAVVTTSSSKRVGRPTLTEMQERDNGKRVRDVIYPKIEQAGMLRPDKPLQKLINTID